MDEISRILLAPKKHLVGNKHRRLGHPSTSTNVEEIINVENGHPVLEDHQKTLSNADTITKSMSSKINQSLYRKLPEVCEATSIMVGISGNMRKCLSCFVRLKSAKLFLDSTELPISTRFVYIILIPSYHYNVEPKSLGRCFGTLMVDEVFSKIAYKTKNGFELGYAVEEFINQCVVVPAGKWNPAVRWEPPENQAPVERRLEEPFDVTNMLMNTADIEEESDLRRTGILFGGFVDDVDSKSYWYVSDYTDALKGRITQTLAAAIFLFFANISKIITFGGVMDNQLHKQMGAIENVLAGGICGVVYALFSGQPLCVLSATGPCLVFEVIMHNLCSTMQWEFLPVRAWLGMWTAVFLVIYVALDASVLVALITRFTEEAFATMISVIFLVKAVDELMEIKQEYPITTDPRAILNDPRCLCYGINSTDFLNNSSPLLSNNSSPGIEMAREGHSLACQALKGTSVGAGCSFAPEVRNIIADFNAILAILIMTLVNYFVGIKVPCLNVPDSLTPTIPRPWLVDIWNIEHWWIAVLAFLPASFFSILVMMDQNITSVIINRPDNKLKKGYGYHLDLFVIAILMVVCSLFGLPFYVAATVISLLHVDSLRIMSETAAPGEKPRFLGIKEQRATALLAHILIGLAVFLTPVMKHLPMPVLLGVFLYIGIVSLSGQQFGQRVLLLFMPMKHQPDYQWLRSVRMKRVHLFTAVQLISFIILLFVEENKQISMFFPLMLFVMVLIRKVIMDRMFTQKELMALDDVLPTWAELFRVSNRRNRVEVNCINRKISGQRKSRMSLTANNKQETFRNGEETLKLEKFM
uniref:Anion exchange protein n=1 Tax=Romanomermis culicivorax TaxID=13658 RepID=A0A915KE64_ROMCU